MKILIALYYLYHLLFFLTSLALTRPRTGTPAGTGQNRLAVLVPAHNEQNVIASSVRSILSSDYPRDKFDVYVIADNCTDETASLARAAGALVLERKNKTLRGKQHALKWAFDQINLDSYDAVVILDADNHIDPGFLAVMDHYLATGYRVIQGYVETKNPGDFVGYRQLRLHVLVPLPATDDPHPPGSVGLAGRDRAMYQHGSIAPCGVECDHPGGRCGVYMPAPAGW